MVGTTNQSETCWGVEGYTEDMEWCVKECRGAWQCRGECREVWRGTEGMWKDMKGHKGDIEHGGDVEMHRGVQLRGDGWSITVCPRLSLVAHKTIDLVGNNREFEV